MINSTCHSRAGGNDNGTMGDIVIVQFTFTVDALSGVKYFFFRIHLEVSRVNYL